MRSRVKTFLILIFLCAGSQAFAYTSDYQPMFLPKQNKKSVMNLKNNLQKDFSQLQFILKQKKKARDVVKKTRPSKKSASATSAPKTSLPL